MNKAGWSEVQIAFAGIDQSTSDSWVKFFVLFCWIVSQSCGRFDSFMTLINCDINHLSVQTNSQQEKEQLRPDQTNEKRTAWQIPCIITSLSKWKQCVYTQTQKP